MARHAILLTMDAVRFRGGMIRYRTIGPEGAPWLVVNHGMALNHRDFLHLGKCLADRWRVLLWDMPGHGKSQPGLSDCTAAAMAEAQDVVMTAARANRAVLLGFSFGGVVAQLFARAHPERVAGLIAYGCFAPFYGPAMPGALAGPLITLAYGWRSWSAIRRDFARRCAVTPAARATVAEAMAPVGKAGFLAMARALLAAGAPDPAFRFACPLLLIRGAEDSNGKALTRAAVALAAAHPTARQVVIPNSGHCAHLDRPEAFIAGVEAFLATLERP